MHGGAEKFVDYVQFREIIHFTRMLQVNLMNEWKRAINLIIVLLTEI
jgi:hypothetical protein